MPSNLTAQLYLGDILICPDGQGQGDSIGKYGVSNTLTVNYQSISYNQYAVGPVNPISTVISSVVYDQYFAYAATTGTVP